MLRMVSHPHRPLSGHIMCYLIRTYHVLPTWRFSPLDPVLLPVLSSPLRPFMLGNRSWDDWIAQYSTSHQNPVNRLCHTIGIPLIVLSLIFFVVTIFVHRFWPIALGLFIVGWIFQFVGHAFEGKPPEFFSDWRFLLVGTRWWAAKVRGRV